MPGSFIKIVNFIKYVKERKEQNILLKRTQEHCVLLKRTFAQPWISLTHCCRDGSFCNILLFVCFLTKTKKFRPFLFSICKMYLIFYGPNSVGQGGDSPIKIAYFPLCILMQYTYRYALIQSTLRNLFKLYIQDLV